MTTPRKRPSYLSLCFVAICLLFITGCALFERIVQGLSDFQRDADDLGAFAEFQKDVDALRTRPQAPLADFTPRGISMYLAAWPAVDTGAEFLRWLPREFKEDWIMMTRSESLQTGTASSPRIILSNGNKGANKYQYVFALTLQQDRNFPLADPNVVEYMQFDDTTSKFRFHEIDLRKPAPLSRVSIDNPKCLHCHGGSRDNLRPNWDAYDSWGGMLPFNRDRVYEGSVEETAIKRILNTTQSPDLAPIIGQLSLPEGITRAGDGSITINYRSSESPSTTENDYLFAGSPASVPPAGSPVPQGGPYLTIDQATDSSTEDVDGNPDQGRGIELFDELTTHNAQRVRRELVKYSKSGTIDVRPIAAAIAHSCTEINPNSFNTILTADQILILNKHHGHIDFDALKRDTRERRESLPRRKADIQKFNLDGLDGLSDGLIRANDPDDTTDVARIRKEVFRRPGGRDEITRLMVDREVYGDYDTKIALFRFFLEPLGIAVDKWSMSVRGRSRSYTFADGVTFPKYISAMQSLGPSGCPRQLINDAKTQIDNLVAKLGPLKDRSTPTPAEVQNILNRNCTECHSSFGYRPSYSSVLDFTEGAGYANAQDRARTGELMRRITMDTPLPRMPLGGPPLSQADMAALQRWVNAGAP